VVTALRRRLSGVLARWAVRVNPDPPLSFTTRRRIDVDYPDLASHVTDVMVGRASTYQHDARH
jgi:hypothetical protein